MPETPVSEPQFDRRVLRGSLIALACIAGALLLTILADVLLLAFACTLTALILVTFADHIRRRVPMPQAAALTLAVLAVVIVLGGSFWFFGRTMSGQFTELAQRLPAAWASVQARLQGTDVGNIVLARAQSFAPTSASIVGLLTTAVSIGTEILSGLVLVIVGGLYLAAQPGLYGGGLIRLIPARGRAEGAATLTAIADALRGWLKGQGIGMVFVGVGTGAGLAIAGVPAALAIGLVAGIGEFVPYLGTIVAGVPAVLLGFSVDSTTGLWALAVLLGVQQVQGHVVMPLLQKQMVDLPPALTVFGIVAAGILLGPVGILLATPLTVVSLVLVRRLYLGDTEPLAATSDAPPRTARSPRRSTRSGSPSPS